MRQVEGKGREKYKQRPGKELESPLSKNTNFKNSKQKSPQMLEVEEGIKMSQKGYISFYFLLIGFTIV